MEVLRLNTDKVLVAREQCISHGINDGRFSAVIPAYQSSNATVESDVKRRIAVAELAKVLDSYLRQVHALPSSVIPLYSATPVKEGYKTAILKASNCDRCNQ